MTEEATEIENDPAVSGSRQERLVINGYDAKLILPDDGKPILFLVDNTCGDPCQPYDTWFGYRDGDKWMGVAEDEEGWQEMAGDILCWIPFPMLSL